MKNKMIFSIFILVLSVQPLCAQEQHVQPAQTEQKALEKKSWWTSTRKKIVFGLSAIGAAAAVVVGGIGYNRSRSKRELNNALFWQVMNDNNPEKVERLLKAGASPNVVVEGVSYSNLGSAVAFYKKDKNNYKIIELLLDYKGNPNLNEENGITPVSLAVMANKPEVLKLLLDRGGNVSNVKAIDGEYLLDFAKQKQFMKIVKILWLAEEGLL